MFGDREVASIFFLLNARLIGSWNSEQRFGALRGGFSTHLSRRQIRRDKRFYGRDSIERRSKKGLDISRGYANLTAPLEIE